MGKNLPANAGNVGLIPGPGRSPGEGNDNPFQYTCLGNPMDTGTWWATVHGVTELDTTKQVSTHAHLSVQDKGCTLIAHVTNTVPR